MYEVTISYGTNNKITKNFAVGTTVQQVLSNAQVKAGLGYGENVVGHMCGAPVGGSTPVHQNAVITVHNQECKKADDGSSLEGAEVICTVA